MRRGWWRFAVAGLLAVVLGVWTAEAGWAAAPWLAPAPFAPSSTTGVSSPSVSVAPDGQAVAGTDRSDGTQRLALVASRPGGAALDAAIPLSEAGAPVAANSVRTAIDRQGNATAAWRRTLPGPPATNRVETAYRPAGRGWQPVQVVAANSTSDVRLAVGDGGAAVLVFTQAGSPTERVYSATRGAGASSFSTPAPISPVGIAGDGIFDSPDVAMDAAGDYIAVWQRSYDVDGGGPEPRDYHDEAVAKPVGGVLGAVRSLTPLTGGTAPSSPRVAMNGAGRAVLAWDFRADDTGLVSVSSADFTPGSTWAAGTFSEPGTLSGTSISGPPQVAIGPSGSATVTYGSPDGVRAVARTSSAGGFSAPQTVSGAGAEAYSSVVAQGNTDAATVVWTAREGDVRKLYSATRAAGDATFANVTEVTSVQIPAGGNAGFTGFDLGLDDQGNGLLVAVDYVTENGTTTYTARASALDAAAPTVGPITAAATAVTGQPVAFAAPAADRLGDPSLSWAFGDGATATGASPTHAYAAPGTYTVRVIATDGVGRAATAERTIQVSPAPVTGPGPAPGIEAAPRLSGLRLSNTRFRTTKRPKGASKKIERGTRVTLTSSEPATVRYAVTRLSRGRRVGKRCVAKTRRNRNARSCKRSTAAGAFSRAVKAGSASFALPEKPGGKLLVPGSYRLTARATDPAGQRSAAVSVAFTVRR